MTVSITSIDPECTSMAAYDLPKHVLDAVEEVALFLLGFALGTWLELFLRQRQRKPFEQLPLLFRELRRCLHLHGREQIPLAAAVHVRHALAAQPQRGAGLGSRMHLHRLGAVERRHTDFAAQ